MSQTHDVGPFYFHTMHYPKDAPRVERAFTTEIERPFRKGKSICIRIGSTAYIFGKWGKPDSEGAGRVTRMLLAKPAEIPADEIRTWPCLGENLSIREFVEKADLPKYELSEKEKRAYS